MFWLNDIFSHSSHVVVIAVCVSSALKQPLRSIHTVTRSLPSLHAGTNQLIFERSELNCFSHLSFQFNHSLLTDVHSTVYMSPEASRTEGSDSGSFRKKKLFWSGPKPHITACVTHCEPDPDLLDVLYMSNSKPRYFTPFFFPPHTHMKHALSTPLLLFKWKSSFHFPSRATYCSDRSAMLCVRSDNQKACSDICVWDKVDALLLIHWYKMACVDFCCGLAWDAPFIFSTKRKSVAPFVMLEKMI